MGAIVWFARIIILLLVLRFVLRMLFPRRPVARRQPMPGNQAQERVGGELVRDPNCGTHIPKARAIAAGTGADLKYFCSTTCRDEFARK